MARLFERRFFKAVREKFHFDKDNMLDLTAEQWAPERFMSFPVFDLHEKEPHSMDGPILIVRVHGVDFLVDGRKRAAKAVREQLEHVLVNIITMHPVDYVAEKHKRREAFVEGLKSRSKGKKK